VPVTLNTFPFSVNEKVVGAFSAVMLPGPKPVAEVSGTQLLPPKPVASSVDASISTKATWSLLALIAPSGSDTPFTTVDPSVSATSIPVTHPPVEWATNSHGPAMLGIGWAAEDDAGLPLPQLIRSKLANASALHATSLGRTSLNIFDVSNGVRWKETAGNPSGEFQSQSVSRNYGIGASTAC
jgi:hypothetical protein